MRHNISTTKLPPGEKRQSTKKLIRRSDFGEREKNIMCWVLDQAESWVITVSQICVELGLTEKKWVKSRDKLIAAGILKQEKIIIDKGATLWRLCFDFTQFKIELSNEIGGAKYIKVERSGNLYKIEDDWHIRCEKTHRILHSDRAAKLKKLVESGGAQIL